MKSVFDPVTRTELANRINSIDDSSKTQWGKMNAFQMMKHCTLCDEMILGKLHIKRVFIGRLIGGIFLKKVLKDDKPFGRNAPTSPVLQTTADSGNINDQKKLWIGTIEQYGNYNNPKFVHPFFGPMTREQVGLFAYKHADHHLRQLGA